MARPLLVLLMVALGGPSVAVAKDVDFAHEIVPLFKAHCAKCHTDGKYKGSFSLDTRESILKAEAVVPGKSGESDLLRRLTIDDPEERMPPEGPGLNAAEVALVKSWIDQGMTWEAGFTFKKAEYVAPLSLKRPTLPPARDGRDHPIDRIIDQYLAEHKVTPPANVDDHTIFRRASLDLAVFLPAPAKL
ncbi:c-type cytochrome domain-containing protein, partial [Singulisphaera rosea]